MLPERELRLRGRAAVSGAHVAALEAAGYEVEMFDIDAPPENGGSPNPAPQPPIKYPTHLGVLAHFDAVNYYSGDDFIPQEITDTDPRRTPTATTQTGHHEMAPWAHKVMLELRDYANEGGKLVVDGRNVHQPFTSTSTAAAAGPYTWTPGQAVRLLLPAEQRGDDDLPGTAWQRSRTISNDTWQNYLGVVGRHRRQRRHGHQVRHGAGHPGGRLASTTAWRPFTLDTAAGNDPARPPAAARAADEVAAAPAQLDQRLAQRAAAAGAVAGRLRDVARTDGQRWRDHHHA